jgi:hypothetical protein
LRTNSDKRAGLRFSGNVKTPPTAKSLGFAVDCPPVGSRRRPPGSWSSETTVDGYDAGPWTPSLASLMRNSRGRNRTRRALGRAVDRFDRSPGQPEKRASEKDPADVLTGPTHRHQGRYAFLGNSDALYTAVAAATSRPSFGRSEKSRGGGISYHARCGEREKV